MGRLMAFGALCAFDDRSDAVHGKIGLFQTYDIVVDIDERIASVIIQIKNDILVSVAQISRIDG